MLNRWPFANLAARSFDLIVADPPWRFATYSPKGKEKKSAECHYETMGLAQIKALPVADLAAKDCALFLWVTNPMLPEGLDVMASWGFSYKSHAVWAKTTRSGKIAFGTGYRLRSAHETILLGTRGQPRNSRGERSLFMAPLREHSRKPEAFFAMCERWMPEARRLDLFSRESRSGWASWGDESGKFDASGRDLEVEEAPKG